MTNRAVYTVLRFLGIPSYSASDIIVSNCGPYTDMWRDHLASVSKEEWSGIRIDLIYYFTREMRVLLLQNMKDLPPEYSKAVDENFWDLIG